MATYTENYNLEMPDQNDFYNIDVQNQNMQKIDTALAAAGNNPELEGNVAGLVEKIGTTTDVGGSNTTGSVMGKLNKAMDENAALKEYIQKELHPDVNCYSSTNIKDTLWESSKTITSTSSVTVTSFVAEYTGSVQLILTFQTAPSDIAFFGVTTSNTSLDEEKLQNNSVGYGSAYINTKTSFSVNVEKGKTYYLQGVVRSGKTVTITKCEIAYDTYVTNFSPIRSMQSGFIKANKSVVDVTINPVNTSKCIVLVFPAYNGANDSATSAVYSNFTGTSIRVQGGYTSGYTWVNWTIIEFY